MAIPKVIHYCWFGGNRLPSSAKKCIESWKKFCPDYQIVQWDERNFDMQCSDFCKAMSKRKKWAFLSDYARLKIVYECGGIYLDTDVEMVRSFDTLLNCDAFMGIDTTYLVATGLGFGAVAGHPFLRKNMEQYDCILDLDNPPLNSHLTNDLFRKNKDFDEHSSSIQLVENVTIFPPDYFCAKHTHSGIITITKNTYSIHHFALSWATDSVRNETQLRWKKEQQRERILQIKRMVRKLIGNSRVEKLKQILHRK